MTIVKDGQGPYAPTLSVMSVIHAFRKAHPATPFTVDNLQLVGVSASLAPRVLQALKLLDLTDEQGEPTAAMHALRDADRKEFPSRLAEVVRAAYAEVFAYRDPVTSTPDDIGEIFRFYRPPSMQPRMLRLFYGLCREAGIVAEVPEISNAEGGGGMRAGAPRTRASKRTGEPPQAQPSAPLPPTPQLPAATSLEGMKARYVEVLLGRLETADGGFDADLADRIERIMGVPAGADPEQKS
jgi:hypothetical protein